MTGGNNNQDNDSSLLPRGNEYEEIDEERNIDDHERVPNEGNGNDDTSTALYPHGILPPVRPSTLHEFATTTNSAVRRNRMTMMMMTSTTTALVGSRNCQNERRAAGANILPPFIHSSNNHHRTTPGTGTGTTASSTAIERQQILRMINEALLIVNATNINELSNLGVGF